MKPNNPFVIAGYRGPDYFCDRVVETRNVVSAIRNERNVTLLAPRRYGKTGLIHNVFHELGGDYVKVYLDIYATTDLCAFTQALAAAVIGSLDTGTERVLAAFGRFFSAIRPTVEADGTGGVSLSFKVAPDQAERTLKGVFDYIASKSDRRIVIAIDEFQQILTYPEKGVEALLRSYVQFADNAQFVFSGSQRHLMGEMFTSPRHPFYQSTDILSLDVISCESYCAFARSFFRKARRPFSDAAFMSLYRRFNGITWYVQSVLNRVWSEENGLRDAQQVEDVVSGLVAVRALTYHDLLMTQTSGCRALLKAVAREGVVPEITAGAFIAKYDLVACSSVRTALTSLLEHDLVYREEQGYVIYDRLFGDYLRLSGASLQIAPCQQRGILLRYTPA